MRTKAYGVILHAMPNDREVLALPPGHTQVRAVVAAPSLRVAAQLLGITLGNLRNYGGETANEVEVAAAQSKPGTVFVRALDDHKGEYVERPGEEP